MAYIRTWTQLILLPNLFTYLIIHNLIQLAIEVQVVLYNINMVLEPKALGIARN